MMTNSPIVTLNKISNFGLAKAIYPPNLKQSRHLHESASLSFVISGGFAENSERKERIFQPLTLIVHSAQKSHSVEFYNRSVHILNVQMDVAFLARFSTLSKNLEYSTSCRSENIAWLGNRLAREFAQIDELSSLAIEGIILEMLVEVSRQISNKDKFEYAPWLKQAKDYLHDNFSEAVGLEEVAKIVGIHPVHLARVFRRRFGCTMGEYVRHLRIEFTKKQLSLTDQPLCEIALSAGFSDQSHLNKTFKNLLGITPNQFRRNYRQG